ncbi:MAG: SDR family oxidoreductase, partial [Azospirillaceae bacterium]
SASRGLGYACATRQALEGVDEVMAARTRDTMEEAADRIRAEAPGVTIGTVAADVTADDGIQALLAACPEPDILVNNAGGPPPGDFRDWDRETWHKAIDANMLAAIFLMKETVDGMMARGFGRVVNITSGAVKAPISILGLSNGARAGLTGFVAGLSRETVARGVTINNLLPGPFDTDRLASNFAARAKREGKTPDQVRQESAAHNPARRFGDPDEFGAACAFLCSVHAGFMTGQNILLDGGAFPGTL